ncbi:phosphatase PAP2 family protein [Geodermatophilus sp. URMC 61]|uniref:phosphatase PAP2 family protein n=1 Tax=Geodermatophilus sp. URMC 61 TaxID=3423411 RepID=UPI00406D3743
MRGARHWDARLHTLVGGLPDTPADVWLRRLTAAADHGRVWMATGALLALRRGALRRGAVRGLASMAVSSGLVNSALKPVFGRRRPDLGAHPVHRLLRHPLTTHSFPSGHSSSAGAFVTGVALECPAAGAALAPLAAAVAYSRVHVGVHYPGDVVAGLAVGAAVAVSGRRWWPVRPTTPARVRTTHSAPALPGGEGLVVAVNPRSGPADYDPAADVRRLLPRAEIREQTAGTTIADLLEEAVRSGRPRALGVAGGDGSVAAAAAVAVAHGLPLAVLPAGTLNHFARDVGVPTLEAAADAVVSGRAVEVDVAEVNGTPFLNTASIGSYPEMVRRRDALAGRLGRWTAMAVAVAQTLRRGTPVSLLLDGRPLSVWILFVGNGRYTPRGLALAWRPRLEDGLLDVQYLRADVPFSRTRAVLGSLLGLSPHVSGYAEGQAQRVRVVSRSGPQEVAYDGETGQTATEFVFAKHGRLTVYCCRDR